MDIVLGVSMTPTTVRMVLVEGEKADGVDRRPRCLRYHRQRRLSNVSNAAEQVAAAVLGTQESAAASGHHLKSIGVTWTHHSDAAALRDTIAARGIEDVMLVSATHAAASLAQAVGRAIGYDTTALLFIEKDTATLSVVQTEDGSVVKVLSRDLHDSDAMAVLTEMATAVESAESPPQGMFIVGSGVDAQLGEGPPGEPGGPARQRARRTRTRAGPRRGARVGACARDGGLHRRPGLLAGSRRHHRGPRLRTPAAGRRAATQMAPVGCRGGVFGRAGVLRRVEEPSPSRCYEDESRKPFLLVGSALTSIFVVGVVALVISLAVSIRPTVDQRPSPGRTPSCPSQAAPAPARCRKHPQPAPAPAAAASAAGDHQGARARRVQEARARAQAGTADGVRRAAAPAPAAPAPAPAPAAPPPAR